MKRHHPYYLLERKDIAKHHFEVGYVYHDQSCNTYTWDGNVLELKISSWGMGMSTVTRIPSEFEHVVPLIKADVCKDKPRDQVEFHGFIYHGFYADYRVTRLTLLEHVDYPRDPRFTDPTIQWSWDETDSESYKVMIFADRREAQPILSGGDRTSNRPPPTHVVDYCGPVLDENGIAQLPTDQCITIQEYNAKYNLEADVSLDIFNPAATPLCLEI